MTRNMIKLPRSEFLKLPSYFYNYTSFGNKHAETELLGSFDDSKARSVVENFHAKAIKNGSSQKLGVSNNILSLYVKSKNLEHAQRMFDEITGKDVRSWTILISGFARIRSHRLALDLFIKMQVEGVLPNQFTLSSVLKCCSWLNELRLGKGVHGWILRNGTDLDVALENSILDLYVKCCVFHYVENVFELMVEKDTVSWNIMVGAYLLNGDREKSLDLFWRLPFKDVSSWNTVIAGQMQNGFEETAFELLHQMVAIGPAFNRHTFSIALVLVSSLSILEVGMEIHGRVLRVGIDNDRFIRDSLINMYCKCGKMEKASILFQKLAQDVAGMQDSKTFCDNSIMATVSWNSMVSSYVHNGRWEEALQIFRNMVCEQISVDKFTITSIVSACAIAGVLELGRQIHAHILKIGHKLDAIMGSSLIDMYSKCGSLDDARLIFKQTNDLNVVLWTSLISSCALHGKGREAVWLFESMIDQGIRPNEVSFVGVLTACSHAGLLEEGRRYFESMEEVYGVRCGVEHFTCMVDLFSRAGCFNETKDFIYKNNISHLTAVWTAFLSSCRVHKNIEMGKWVSEKLLKLEPSKPQPYLLLSNIWAINDRWGEAGNVRAWMHEIGARKHPGWSWVRVKNQIHTFFMGDRSHPKEAEIYSYLNKLIGRVNEIGYSADVKQVMQDVEEEQKEELLGFHSEKLAIAYAVMCTATKTPIQIMKNLRICTDCHNFIKYISQLLEREIVVRDIHRFHHFKDGRCSCGNYW
ncbi:putative pentatricopeptide repeat-containing protein At3g23330 [Malania oleifera]|uniref:putative pentatricopeptide repeat-containing protein At3g23330 n=1 Tax=Malania oleifera TaxID=397392 RepID=UPI0025AE9652|nr:putative pentatricopeptide repeat-containing protein At3g23330 [Malania oleifera]